MEEEKRERIGIGRKRIRDIKAGNVKESVINLSISSLYLSRKCLIVL